MKALLKPIIFSLFCLFAVSLSFSQETITIKLLVDTANFSPSNFSASCSFEATWSNSGRVVTSNGDLENFAIDAFVDDTIIWEAISTSSSETIIDIKKVDRENNSRIFNSRRQNGRIRGNSNKETVEAKVLNSTQGLPDYKYKIFFQINHRGATYKIDPKIRVGTRG